MATTTNYGWTTPDDTSLVKDGASAIRTLGSSVDTTVKNLNPETTLGDISYRSSTANTNTRLAIGTTGQVLTVNGGVPTWATASSGGMTLISTTTLTGASVTLSSIPQTYNNLFIVVRSFRPANDGETCQFRFNADSTANRHRTLGNSLTQQGTAISFDNTLISANAGQDNGSDNSLITIEIPDYTNTATWKRANLLTITNEPTTNTQFTHYISYGFYNQTSAISSLQFFPSGGNFTSGTILLYGVK